MQQKLISAILIMLTLPVACQLSSQKNSTNPVIKDYNLTDQIVLSAETIQRGELTKVPLSITVGCNSTKGCVAATGKLTIKGAIATNDFENRPFPNQIKFGLNDSSTTKETLDFTIPALSKDEERIYPEVPENQRYVYIRIGKDSNGEYPPAGDYAFTLIAELNDSLGNSLVNANLGFSIVIPKIEESLVIKSINFTEEINIPITTMLDNKSVKVPFDITIECQASNGCKSASAKLKPEGRFEGNAFKGRPLPNQIKFGLNDANVVKETLEFTIPKLANGEEYTYPKPSEKGSIYIKVLKDANDEYPLPRTYGFSLSLEVPSENASAHQNFSIIIPIGTFILPAPIAQAGRYNFNYVPHPRAIVEQVQFFESLDGTYKNSQILSEDSTEPFRHRINYDSTDNGTHNYFVRVYESLQNNDFTNSNIRELKVEIK